MSETIFVALVAAGFTLLKTTVTVVVNAGIENNKRKTEVRQKYYETKRDNLNYI